LWLLGGIVGLLPKSPPELDWRGFFCTGVGAAGLFMKLEEDVVGALLCGAAGAGFSNDAFGPGPAGPGVEPAKKSPPFVGFLAGGGAVFGGFGGVVSDRPKKPPPLVGLDEDGLLVVFDGIGFGGLKKPALVDVLLADELLGGFIGPGVDRPSSPVPFGGLTGGGLPGGITVAGFELPINPLVAGVLF
ncbi:hypothetical protein GJ744_005175, partial [Endocarpon pusillum]